MFLLQIGMMVCMGLFIKSRFSSKTERIYERIRSLTSGVSSAPRIRLAECRTTLGKSTSQTNGWVYNTQKCIGWVLYNTQQSIGRVMYNTRGRLLYECCTTLMKIMHFQLFFNTHTLCRVLYNTQQSTEMHRDECCTTLIHSPSVFNSF